MNFHASDVGLATNIYYFVGTDGQRILDGAADGVLASAVVTLNDAAINCLIPNTTYN